MNIKFLGTKVSKLSLLVDEDNESKLEDDFQLSFNNGYSENDDNSFIVRFFVNFSSKEEKFKLDLEYIGFFSADESISEEFKSSHFPTINAPAIAYPFMRSFINTITINANLNPVILPTINFQELVQQK
ncbi:MAG: protein-export chaperone SecB [Candidatus Marithrix sp.]